MELLKNIFGKKNNNYYLELKETAEEVVSTAQETVEEVVSTAIEAVDNNLDKTKEVVTETATEAKEAVTKTATNAKQKVETETASVKETVKEKAPTKEAKSKSTSKNQNKQTATTQPIPQASTYEPPFWVKAMYKNSNNGNGKAAQSQKTFATDNLMPTISNARRLPGPSLNKFKEMANKARTPRG